MLYYIKQQCKQDKLITLQHFISCNLQDDVDQKILLYRFCNMIPLSSICHFYQEY